jgi:hypothetical protein
VPLTVVRETVTVRSPLTVSSSVGEVKQSSILYAAEGGLLVAQFPAASAGAGRARGIGSAPTVSANATVIASVLRVADHHVDVERLLCFDMILKLCNEGGKPGGLIVLDAQSGRAVAHAWPASDAVHRMPLVYVLGLSPSSSGRATFP